MAGAAMPVSPPIIPGQEPVERLDHVCIRAAAQLHYHQAGGGVRREQVQEPVLVGGHVGNESLAGGG